MSNGATTDQIIPLWHGFYHNLSRERTSYTTVIYSPIIDAKPATMYTTMRKCKDMSAALGQHHAFQTIDLQLYAFVQQLKWAFPDELPKVEIYPVTNIPILGSFTPDITDPSSDLNVWIERESDRGLHLQTQQVMVLHFFVTDRHNNARWTPFYSVDVLNLTYKVRSPCEAG